MITNFADETVEAIESACEAAISAIEAVIAKLNEAIELASQLESIGGGLLTLEAKPFLYNQRDTVLNGGFIAFKDQYCKKIAYEALQHSGILD